MIQSLYADIIVSHNKAVKRRKAYKSKVIRYDKKVSSNGCLFMSRNEKVTTFLKDCITDALIEKMKEKPFEKITADEIVKTAGVGAVQLTSAIFRQSTMF